MTSATPAWAHELERVDSSLATGDLPHALMHLGAALAVGPNEERVLAAVEAFAAKHSLLELLPKSDFLGAHLLEAFALRRVGRVDEAVILLAQITEGFPARRFETLLATWLVTARASQRTLSDAAQQQVLRVIVNVGQKSIGLHRLFAGERELLAGYEALADAALDGATLEPLFWGASGLYRRLGLFEKSIATVSKQDSYFFLIQRGLALRASGDAKAALAAFERASALPDANDSDVLEQVRCHFILGNVERARELLTRITRTDDELAGLKTLCSSAPQGDGVEALDRLRRDVWRPPVELPGDATANLFVQHREQLLPGKAVGEFAISGWESPSNRLLVALFVSGTSDVTRATYSMQHVGPAFTRPPFAQVHGEKPPTWVEQKGLGVQATPAPSATLRSQLAAVATTDLFSTVWTHAGRLAATLDAKPADVIAAMVHPPEDDAWLQGLPRALYRYQVACACVLAQLPRPWSELRSHFESLLFGPVDWSSAAAVQALGEKARRDAEAARDGLAMLSSLVNDLLPHSAEPRASPLLHELGALHCVSGETSRALRAWFQAQFPEEKDTEPTPEAAEKATNFVAPAMPQRPQAAPVRSEAVTAAPEAKASIPGWVWLVGTLALVAALLKFAH
jgi:tetratricopeptide (TPR) repeat protein